MFITHASAVAFAGERWRSLYLSLARRNLIMQLTIHEARQLLVRIMSGLGHDADDAGLIADHLIDCELRGLTSELRT